MVLLCGTLDIRSLITYLLTGDKGNQGFYSAFLCWWYLWLLRTFTNLHYQRQYRGHNVQHAAPYRAGLKSGPQVWRFFVQFSCDTASQRKGLYAVARNFFLLLLIYSAVPCLGPAQQNKRTFIFPSVLDCKYAAHTGPYAIFAYDLG